MRPVYHQLDDDGKEWLVASDEPADQLLIDRRNGVSVGYEALDPGRYHVGFVARDFADHRTLRLTRIDVR